METQVLAAENRTPMMQEIPMTREQIQTTADLLRYELARYRAWRCHTDDHFNAHFVALQQWQVEHLKARHANLLADERYAAVTQFFLSDMYGGLDLRELAAQIERAVPIACRLLPDSVMRTSAGALELNALTGELDEELATEIFEVMGEREITVENYGEAFRRCDQGDRRERQLELVRELAIGLDKYVRSRVIYATFRIANKPAHMAGLGKLYDFLDRGFSVMRPMGSASEFINLFTGKEEVVLQNLLARHPDPFNV